MNARRVRRNSSLSGGSCPCGPNGPIFPNKDITAPSPSYKNLRFRNSSVIRLSIKKVTMRRSLKECGKITATVNDTHEDNPVRLFTLEEDIRSDRKGEEAWPQIFTTVSAHARSFGKLPRLVAQSLNKAAGCFGVVLGNV